MELALLAGALVGLGLTLVIREFAPGHPDLTSALGRLHNPVATPVTPTDGRRSLQASVGLAVERRLRGVSFIKVPQRDLALLRIPAHEWFGEKALLALLGLVMPHVVSALFGSGVVGTLPAAGGLLLAVVLWLVPDASVRRRAAEARDEFARAVAAYIELAALERAAGSGTTEALERAADVGQSWVFRRLREELVRSRWSGTPPWTALKVLAEELDLPELRDLADIMRLSGEEGATVYETLRARARGLRNALLSKEQARANADSERLVVPVALLGMVFLVLIATPAFLRITGG